MNFRSGIGAVPLRGRSVRSPGFYQSKENPKVPPQESGGR